MTHNHLEQLIAEWYEYLGYFVNLMAEQLIEEIFIALKNKRLESNAIPEQLTILRSFQYVNQYRHAVIKAWNTPAR